MRLSPKLQCLRNHSHNHHYSLRHKALHSDPLTHLELCLKVGLLRNFKTTLQLPLGGVRTPQIKFMAESGLPISKQAPFLTWGLAPCLVYPRICSTLSWVVVPIPVLDLANANPGRCLLPQV